jgi:hypothetical protein
MRADRIGYSVVRVVSITGGVRARIVNAARVSNRIISFRTGVTRSVIVRARGFSNGIMQRLATRAVRISLTAVSSPTAVNNLTAMSSLVASAGTVTLNSLESTLVARNKLNFHDTHINESRFNKPGNDNVTVRTTRAVHIVIHTTRVSTARGSKLTARATLAYKGNLARAASLAFEANLAASANLARD